MPLASSLLHLQAFIQRVFRGMKGRQLARQKRIERAEWLRRINLGARQMQRVVRGRIGRKIARVERALKRIKVRSRVSQLQPRWPVVRPLTLLCGLV